MAKRNTLSSQVVKAQEDLPVVDLVGLAKTPRGWVVVEVRIQGDRVLEKEVVSKDPEPKGYAAKRCMIHVAKTFAVPEGDA
jgi:hypothetical protein